MMRYMVPVRGGGWEGVGRMDDRQKGGLGLIEAGGLVGAEWGSRRRGGG